MGCMYEVLDNFMASIAEPYAEHVLSPSRLERKGLIEDYLAYRYPMRGCGAVEIGVSVPQFRASRGRGEAAFFEKLKSRFTSVMQLHGLKPTYPQELVPEVRRKKAGGKCHNCGAPKHDVKNIGEGACFYCGSSLT